MSCTCTVLYSVVPVLAECHYLHSVTPVPALVWWYGMLRIWVPTDTYISWFALHLATGTVVSCQNWVDYFSTDKTCFKACPQFDSIDASHHFYAATNDSVDGWHVGLQYLTCIHDLHALRLSTPFMPHSSQQLTAMHNLITIDTKMREPWTICASCVICTWIEGGWVQQATFF